MKCDLNWKNYSVVATGDGYKLENFNGVFLLRPDPQIIWKAPFDLFAYPKLNAIYNRSKLGGGAWDIIKDPKDFTVTWKNLTFNLKLMGFKHTGVFPEQAVNWEQMISLIKSADRPIKVLNLFAYTGGATIACAQAGASVVHIDSAKAMCEKAGQNARSSHLEDKPIRYIVEDCYKFVEREIRRGNTYDAVIMDPPSYGRGANGETWKLEEKISDLVTLTKNILSPTPLFFLINSYTTGLQPTVMKNIIDITFNNIKHTTDAYEVGLPTDDPNVILPCGCSAFCRF